MSSAAIMMLMTVTPPAILAAWQERMLERALVCPASLPDDAARLHNIDRFNRLYASFLPQSRTGERMMMRDTLLAKKKCAPDAGRAQYTFPEE